MDSRHTALLVAVAAVITWSLRALPFAALAPLRHSAVVRYLSVHMAVGVMLMLAVYTLHGEVDGDARHLVWLAIGVAVTVGLHVWRRQAVLSILLGTAVYVTLMSTLP